MATGLYTVRPDEAILWLGILLDAVFDPTSKTINLARSAEIANQRARDNSLHRALALRPSDGKSQLLALASDFTNYPEDYPDTQRAELIESWMERWVQPEDIKRLNARVRKRRQRLKEANL
ncbi:hypothetical protein [Modicisalibacter luteus]|uniref:Uncharacterized protein n=1 Tax=Modicisalibacter luteus TaxID=453962 RepID=A0ABV7M6C1_9GAMM|nr:hypothetical protein [Halomonas lutea]GHB15532.1 hypothetical protein GCM10007159_42240 [Halomonas lutea]